MLIPVAGEGCQTPAAATFCRFHPAPLSQLALCDFGKGLAALDVLYTAR
jgi:hypothetical protein